jgi:hypothetical protein
VAEPPAEQVARFHERQAAMLAATLARRDREAEAEREPAPPDPEPLPQDPEGPPPATRPRPAEPATIATTEDLIRALPEPRSQPEWVKFVAELLCQDFDQIDNQKYFPGFQTIAAAVRAREFPAESVADAYRQAMKPGVRKRGAVFNLALQRNGWDWERRGRGGGG